MRIPSDRTSRFRLILPAVFFWAVVFPQALFAEEPNSSQRTPEETAHLQQYCSSLDPLLSLDYKKAKAESDLRSFNRETLRELSDRFIASFTAEELAKIAVEGFDTKDNDAVIRKKVARLSDNKMQWKVCDSESTYIQRKAEFADGNSMILCVPADVTAFDAKNDTVKLTKHAGNWSSTTGKLSLSETLSGLGEANSVYDPDKLEIESDRHTKNGQSIHYHAGVLTLRRFSPNMVTLTIKVGKEMAHGFPKSKFMAFHDSYEKPNDVDLRGPETLADYVRRRKVTQYDCQEFALRSGQSSGEVIKQGYAENASSRGTSGKANTSAAEPDFPAQSASAGRAVGI